MAFHWPPASEGKAIMLAVMEEGDFPDTADNKYPDEDAVSRAGKMAFVVHGRVEQMQAQFDELKSKMSNERGPDPDYDNTNEILSQLHRAIINLKRPVINNGDGGEANVRKWHLTFAAASIAFVVIGTAWKLSEQMSTQFATQAVRIEAIREHQREQDDRATRIEQRLQELAIERAAHPATP